MSNGKKNWYIADGYLPYEGKVVDAGFQGHEAVMLLNCNDVDANVYFDIFFEDRPPIKDIHIPVGAERIKCIRMDHPDELGGVKLQRQEQYALHVHSDVEIVVQYGRMDIAQSNLAYIGCMGYSE